MGLIEKSRFPGSTFLIIYSAELACEICVGVTIPLEKKAIPTWTNVSIVFNYFKPEFTIVIFIHYKPRIAVAILGLQWMKTILCSLNIKENCHVLVNQFHGNFRSKTLGCRKIKYVFEVVKWCFNASWGLKGLTERLVETFDIDFVSRCGI